MFGVVHEADPNAGGGAVADAVVGGPNLDELCRLAARDMIAVALDGERDAWLEAHVHLTERTVTIGTGRVEVNASRVDDKHLKDERELFSAAVLLYCMHKSPKGTEILLAVYLRRGVTGCFAPALEWFFSSDAGLSGLPFNRLTKAWQAEHERWSTRDLSAIDFVYRWADGVSARVRLPDADGKRDPLCLLVILGVRADGTKEMLTVTDGYRESTESWAELLRDLQNRGMTAPVPPPVGDVVLGLWDAFGQLWTETLPQRCWVHKAVRVLSSLPKRLHPRAEKLLHAISSAESLTDAWTAAKVSADELADHPKEVAKATSDLDVLLSFDDFAEPLWKHLPTTKPYRVGFLKGRAPHPGHHRCRRPAGYGSHGLQASRRREERWRRFRKPEALPLV